MVVVYDGVWGCRSAYSEYTSKWETLLKEKMQALQIVIYHYLQAEKKYQSAQQSVAEFVGEIEHTNQFSNNCIPKVQTIFQVCCDQKIYVRHKAAQN